MIQFDPKDLKKLNLPKHDSTKGENGKLMIIAGSILFHAASLWPLKVASRMVDMVYFSSVPMNNEIVQKDKETFRDGIVVLRKNMDKYIEEADCILIGPGLPRDSGREDKEESSKDLTQGVLTKFPKKRWVIDGGSLQVIDTNVLPESSILTPNKKEFRMLFGLDPSFENAILKAKEFGLTILLKGEEDIVTDGDRAVLVKGGNAGMTKGGTGDVLAGLVASFYCKNDPFLSASCASYINKKAAESLGKRVGMYFNASDLADEIPSVLKNASA